MTKPTPVFLLLAAGFALFVGCGREPPDRSAQYYAEIRRLETENQQVRAENKDLRDLHAQALAELKAARSSAQQASTAVRSAYLAMTPMASVLMVLGAGLSVVIYMAARRRGGR